MKPRILVRSPAFRSGMPWAARVEEFTADGTLIPIVDNGAAIDAELRAHNARLGYDPGFADRQNLSETSDAGCACQMHGSSGHGIAFALISLLGVLRRVSRRRVRSEDNCRDPLRKEALPRRVRLP